MRKTLSFYAPLMLLAISGCRSATPSTTTMVTHTVETRIDTVYVSLPQQSATAHTSDSVSTLRTAYAESHARINADGTMTHHLSTTPDPVAVAVPTTIEKTDTLTIIRQYDKASSTSSNNKCPKWALILILIPIACMTIRKFLS